MFSQKLDSCKGRYYNHIYVIFNISHLYKIILLMPSIKHNCKTEDYNITLNITLTLTFTLNERLEEEKLVQAKFPSVISNPLCILLSRFSVFKFCYACWIYED